MKLSFTSDAKDKLFKLARESEAAANRVAALVARLDNIEKRGLDEFLREKHPLDIAEVDGMKFFHISDGDLNMIFVRDPHQPDGLVLTNFYLDGKSAARERAVA